MMDLSADTAHHALVWVPSLRNKSPRTRARRRFRVPTQFRQSSLFGCGQVSPHKIDGESDERETFKRQQDERPSHPHCHPVGNYDADDATESRSAAQGYVFVQVAG